jgi:hypothetical protein
LEIQRLFFFVQTRCFWADATVVGRHRDPVCLGLSGVSLAGVQKLSQNDGQSTMAVRDCPTISAFNTEIDCEILALCILGLFDRSNCDRKERTSNSRVPDETQRAA